MFIGGKKWCLKLQLNVAKCLVIDQTTVLAVASYHFSLALAATSDFFTEELEQT